MGVFKQVRATAQSCALVAGVLALFLSIGLRANGGPVVADASWTSTTGGSWIDGANWTSSPDYPSGVGAIARFTNIQTANRVFTLDSDITIGEITIDNAMNRTNTIGVLNGTTPTLTLDAVGAGPAKITVTGDSSGSATPNNMFSPVILNEDLLVTVDRSSSTSVAGAFTFRGANVSGVGGITKEGPGTLTLADRVKTYTGATVVNQGRLRINVPAGRPTETSGVIINGVGQLDLAGIGSYTFGAAGAKITLNGPGPANNFPTTFGGAIRVDGAGNNTITNEIFLQSDSSIHIQGAANTTNITNTISGPGGLTLPMPGTDGNIGTLNLSGANTYTGGTVINDGTVTASGASALGAITGALAVNNQNNTQAATNVVLNLSTTAATTTGSLSGTIATPTSGVNTVTINTGGQLFTVNQTTPGTFAGMIADSGGFALGALSSQTLTLSGPNTYSGPTTVAAGTLKVSGSISNSSGVTLTGGSFEAAASQSIHSLSIAAGAVAKVTTSAARTVLSIGDNVNPAPLLVAGRLDLATNAMTVDVPDGADAATLAVVRDAVVAAYRAPGGSWNGNGITSSAAAADPGKGVGYALASEIVGAAGGTFVGASVDGSAVLARFTLLGDASLDGMVDFNDLVALAQNYNQTVSTMTPSWWAHGDFTYDGMVDFADLVKLAQNYNMQLPSAQVPGAPAGFGQDLAAAFASVPEPSLPACAAVIAAAVSTRARRRAASKRFGHPVFPVA